MLFIISWLIESNVRSLKESNAGTVVRILISHLQLVGLCAHYALNWPNPVTIFFNISSALSNVGASQILLLDCLLGTYEDVFPHVFKRAIAWGVTPVVLIIAYTILWSKKADMDGDGTRDELELKDKFLISFFVVNFMLYPTLCKEGMMVFSCISVGDENHWFMNGDMDVECYADARYNQFSLIIMLPMVLLYILGIPLATAVIIFSYRNKLHKPSNVVKLHMLTAGVRESRLMWEVMLLMQKAGFVWVAVYMRKYGQVSQAYAGILVLGVGLLMLLKDHPYKVISVGYDPTTNKFDDKQKGDILQNLASQSYIVLLTTMYLGIFEMIATNYFYEEFNISRKNFSMAMLCVILMANIVYLVQAVRVYLLELHRENQLGSIGGTIMVKFRQLSGLTKGKTSVSKFKKASLRVTSIFDGNKLWDDKKGSGNGIKPAKWSSQVIPKSLAEDAFGVNLDEDDIKMDEESRALLLKMQAEEKADEEMFRKARQAKVKARFKQAMLMNQVSQQYNDSKEAIEKARGALKDATHKKNIGMIRTIIGGLQPHPKMMNALAVEVASAAKVLRSGEQELVTELKEAIKDHENPNQDVRLRDAVDAATEAGVSEPPELISEAEDKLMKLEHLAKLRKMIENLDNKLVAEIKSFKNPPNDITLVLRAVLLCVGTSPGEVSDWDGVRLWVGKTGKLNLKRRIIDLDIEFLKTKKKTVKIVERLIKQVSIARISSVSKGAATFYSWTVGILLDIDPSFAARIQ